MAVFLLALKIDTEPFPTWVAEVGVPAAQLPEFLSDWSEQPNESGYAEVPLDLTEVQSLKAWCQSATRSGAWGHVVDILASHRASFYLLGEPPLQKSEAYFRTRTNLVFDLFNEGALHCREPKAREVLLSSFSFLPNRQLDAAGVFVANSAPTYRTLQAETAAAPQSVGGIDKFPSLLAVRAARLQADQNRIVPSAMLRDGVHVGCRNIFMFHSAVNIGAAIGDDNLIDSHASVGSSANIGNRNKLGSFVSLEGILSPANAEPVEIRDDNFLGTYVRIGTGIKVGDKNFFGSGVNLSLGTPLKDCRESSTTKGQYQTVRELGDWFSNLVILPSNSAREVNGIPTMPGEYILQENTEAFRARFTADLRIRTASATEDSTKKS